MGTCSSSKVRGCTTQTKSGRKSGKPTAPPAGSCGMSAESKWGARIFARHVQEEEDVKREEIIDKIMRDLGGKKIVEGTEVDSYELKSNIVSLFVLASTMNLQAELLEDQIDSIEQAKQFCRHSKKGADILGSMVNSLSTCLFGEKETHDIIDNAKAISIAIHLDAIKKQLKDVSDTSELN